MKPDKRITLEDLSVQTGVSRSTISRVVSNRGYVAAETREQILKAVRESGYRPTKKHKGRNVHDLVMVATGLLTSPVQIAIIESLVPAVEEAGLKALVASTQFSSYRLQEYLLYARDRQFAGIVLLGILETPEVVRLLRTMECPVVLLNQKIRGLDADQILLNDDEGGYQAARHLIDRGHRRLGLLMGYEKATAARQRENGFRRACKEARIELRSTDVYYGDFTERSGISYARELVSKKRDITGIVSCNDLMSAGLIFELTNLGRRIPEDFSVVGFDNTFVTALADTQLTTIDYDFTAVGTEAAAMILSRIDDPFQLPRQTRFPPRLTERLSVASV